MALKVKTSVDGSGFAQGLTRMEEDASKFGKTLSSKVAGNFGQAVMGIIPGLTSAIAGVFSASAVKASLTDFAAQAKDIKYGAIRLNIDEETFQRVNNVMKMTGSDASEVSTAFDKLAESSVKIGEGSKDADKLRMAFAELGIAGKDLESTDYQKIFFKIAEGMKGITPSKEQVAALREIFGRGGDNLLPAFSVGFSSEAAKAGIINDRDLGAIKAYNAEMEKQHELTEGIWNTTKAGALAAWAGIRFMTNPFRWAQEAGTRDSDAFADKKIEEERKRLERIEVEKIKAKEAETALTAFLQKYEYGGELLPEHPEKYRPAVRQAAPVEFHPLGLGNAAIGGIMLGHNMQKEANEHLRRAVVHLANIDTKTKPPTAPGRGFKKEHP